MGRSDNIENRDFYVLCQTDVMCLYINKDFLSNNASINEDHYDNFILAGSEAVKNTINANNGVDAEVGFQNDALCLCHFSDCHDSRLIINLKPTAREWFAKVHRLLTQFQPKKMNLM